MALKLIEQTITSKGSQEDLEFRIKAFNRTKEGVGTYPIQYYVTSMTDDEIPMEYKESINVLETDLIKNKFKIVWSPEDIAEGIDEKKVYAKIASLFTSAGKQIQGDDSGEWIDY